MKIKLMGWQPEHPVNNKLAFIIGSLVGLWKYIDNIHLPIDFISKLFEGTTTAGLCGFAGMAGKWLFGISKEYLSEYFRNRKKQNNGNNN